MIKFTEMKYERPDYEAVKKELQSLTARLRSAASYEEMKDVFFACQESRRKLFTATSLCHIRSDIDTNDAFYDEERRYNNTMMPSLLAESEAWNKALLASPFREDFEREFGSMLFTNIELEEKTESPLIEEELVQESLLTNEYSKIAAGCSTEFRGETCNFYGLLKHMESTDRNERREAFLAWAKLYESVSDKLDDVYYRMVQLRVKMAKKMGYDSYIPYVYLCRRRLDYTAGDAAKFREQVRTVITPAVEKIRKEQAKRLGIDKLHYYDEKLMFPEGNANPHGDRDFMIAAAKKIYVYENWMGTEPLFITIRSCRPDSSRHLC